MELTTLKTERGERAGLYYITTRRNGVWTVEQREEPASYGGGWAWYATRNGDRWGVLDPLPRLRDVKNALADMDRA